MSGHILTPTAQRDLADIRDYYLEEAGHRVARQMLVEFMEAFGFLTRTPGAGHKREDLAEDRPILYRPGTVPLQIITIARGSRDIPGIIGSRRL